MGLTRLRRWAHGYRACAARSCPHRRVAHGHTVWCRDHTDAILAHERLAPTRTPPDEYDLHRLTAARRLGARRWLLLAEVALEREALHVDVLAAIVAQTDAQRRINRPCWTGSRDPRLSTPLDDRVEELLALASTDATGCPENAREDAA